MPNDSSPVSFRISSEERELLEAVAHYMGETLSSFIRRSAVILAQSILEQETPEVVLNEYREVRARRSNWGKEQLLGLEKQLRSPGDRQAPEQDMQHRRGAQRVAARQQDKRD